MRTLITMLILSLLFTISGFSQNKELGTKDKKVVIKDGNEKQDPRKTPFNYDNFELTEDNLAWAKNQIRIEKERAEDELKTGKITQEEYEIRTGKISQAENRIKEFERSIVNNSAISKGEDDKGSKFDPKDAEMVNKKEDFDKRVKDREEREKKKREANMQNSRKNSYLTMLSNIEGQIKQLDADLKAGKISKTDYDTRMSRLKQAEQRIKSSIDELDK